MADLNGKYVNEENHQKVKSKLKKLGIILLIAGAICLAVGVVLLVVGISKFGTHSVNNPQSMFSGSMSSMAMFIFGGLLLAAGLGMLSYGLYATFFAHARDIASYGASTVLPVVNDAAHYVADNTAPAVGKGLSSVVEPVVSSIADPIAEAVTKTKANTKPVCPKCGAQVAKTAKFCKNCGEALQKENICPNCNAKLEDGAKFCENCGHKVK